LKQMKAREIFARLLEQAVQRWEVTCDGLIAGDENKSVVRIGTCFKLTAELIEQAKARSIDMIITHEPTFGCGDLREKAFGTDLEKWKLLDESGIVVYRFHDHAHNTVPDYIHAGFIERLQLPIAKKYENESLGVSRYELSEPTTTRKLATHIKACMSDPLIRAVGDVDAPVKTICLGLGSVGLKQFHYLLDPGCDLFITGEAGEVSVCGYVRDACYFGNRKSVLLLGQFTSEYEGMRLLADKLTADGFCAEYLHSGEVFFAL